MSRASAIGVFDSGVGGLTVVRSLGARLPHEALIYLGDTARVPYGAKSAETVARYSRQTARFLLDRGVKMLLVACNTASAYALDVLRDELAIPVLGAVEPGARAAARATRSGKIGIIGTLGTVRSGAYERALAGLDPRITVTGLACPLFVPLAEEGWLDDDIAVGVARRYLSELAAAAPAIDVLVLGCTHYPLLRPVLHRIARELFHHDLVLVDSAEEMALAAHEELARRDLECSPRPAGSTLLECFVTDDARFDEVATRFLGRPLGSVTRVDL